MSKPLMEPPTPPFDRLWVDLLNHVGIIPIGSSTYLHVLSDILEVDPRAAKF